MTHGIASDLANAGKSVLRRPGFSALVMLTLAIGIGASTAIFSVVDGVLLSDLPYPDPDRLIRVRTHHKGRINHTNSAANFLDYREQIGSIEAVTCSQYRRWHLGETTEPRYVLGVMVSHEFFEVMGVPPALGRPFALEDERPDSDVAVISHGFWQSQFGGRPDVVGRAVLLDAQPFTVVGVMPRGFTFPHREVEVWRPLWIDTTAPYLRGDHNLELFARLADGVTLVEAQREFAAYGDRVVEEYPESYKTFQFGVSAVSLHGSTTGDVRTPLLVLLAAVAFVLLIACANAANLLLVRHERREYDLAVHSALGASRTRIIRQLLAECLVLALGGGLIGLVFTTLGLGAMLALAGDAVPRIDNVQLDLRVLAFAIMVSIVAGLLAGVLPAVKVSVRPPGQTLCTGGRSLIPGGRGMLRRALVIVEVALAVMLVIGAGLMMRTLLELSRVDVGFRTDNVLTARIILPVEGYRHPALVGEFFDSVLDRVDALPGVRAAGIAWRLPLATGYDNLSIVIEGREVETLGEAPTSHFQIASPGYFEALGLAPLRGRVFGESDTVGRPFVAVANQAFERQLLDGADAVGTRVRLWGEQKPWAEIVGVVNDIRKGDLESDVRPTLYSAHAQLLLDELPPDSYYSRSTRDMALVVHADGDLASLASSVRDIVHELDSSVPVSAVVTMEEIRAGAAANREFPAVLLVVFACIALALATVGVYGVVAYSAGRRTHEVGIRLALGAEGAAVRAMIVRDGLVPVLLGILVGLVAAVASMRGLRSLLFKVSPVDPLTLLLVPLVIVSATLVASYIPALRASRVDPAAVLRSE
jgi:putative ABC transport system permease protein